MFAVVKTGGKQYRVAPGDVIRVERLAAEAGALVELGEVLMLGGDGAGIEVGRPRIEGAAVTATVLEQTRGDKILVFKKKRRHNYRRKKGHRQELTVLQIAEILPPGAERKPYVPPAPRPVKKPAASARDKAGEAEAGEPKVAQPKPASARGGAPKEKPAAKKAAPKKAAAPAAKAGKAGERKPAPADKAKGKGGRSKGKE